MKEENRLDNLNTLKEMLLDERKLVTYVSVSKDLCIHVNESKSLLKEIIEELRKKDKNIVLNVNYIISGLLDGNKAQTAVCNEGELSELRGKFKTVFFQHLYSVSPGAPSTESVALMAVNRFEDFPLCTGLIKNNSCVKRPAEEIGNLKTNSQDIIFEQKPTIAVQKKVKEESKSEKNNTSEMAVTKVQQSKSEPIIKTEISSPKKEISNGNLQNNDRKNGNKSQKGIAGFFNKAASSSNKKPTDGIIKTKQNEQKETVKLDKKENVIIKPEKMDVDDDMANEVRQSTKQIKNSSKYNFNQALDTKKKTGKVESLDQIKKTAKVDKKRKRVLHVSDSESEGEKDDPFHEEPMVDLESEDEIPATPSVATVNITSGIVNPRKKRRVVDKTYTDEDGYILTKKEEVYESCSDNEQESSVKENVQNGNVKVKVEVSPKANLIEVVAPKEKTVTKTRKKTASPQKGKQATLMSFFKRKV